MNDGMITVIVGERYAEMLNDPESDPRFRRFHELGVELGIHDEDGNQLLDVLEWGAVGEDPLRDDKLEFIRLSYWISTEQNRWAHELLAETSDIYKQGMLAAEAAAEKRDSCC